MKKIISILLVLTTVLCIFASCGKEESDNQGGNGGNSESDNNYNWPSHLDYSGYDGYDFRILTWGDTGGAHWSAYEFNYDDSISDVVNDAVQERDKKLEEKLGINIIYVVKDKADATESVRTSINAGSDDFDLASISISGAATLAQEGQFLDLYEYKDILHFDEPYWDQNANKQLSIANHLYFTVSDLTLVDKNATWVVFFTKSMIEKYNLCPGYENGLYSMVDQGDWTIEAMYNMVKTVSHDDGDGELNDQDTYGHCGETWNLNALMVGCGSIVTEKNADDIPTYVWTNNVDSLVSSYENVSEIVNNSQYSMLSGRMANYGYSGDAVWTDGFGTMMQQERVLFNVTGMNRCKLYRDLECEFGIIPVPKADKSQEGYHSIVSMGQANCVAIPMTCEDVERTCTILEAMTALASQTTYSAYVDKALTYQYLRDDDSAAMLDIIFDSRVYDAVDVYGWGQGTLKLFGATPAPTVEKLASSMQALKGMTEKSIQKGLDKFEAVYNSVKE